jgi:thioredoxin 1
VLTRQAFLVRDKRWASSFVSAMLVVWRWVALPGNRRGIWQFSFSLRIPFPMPKKSFSELINSPGMPVLVDFYADWCGPCKTMAPILEQVAAQHQGKLKIIKIDVDRNQAVAQQFRVQGIPTLILFHKGQPVWRQSGVVPGPQLTQAVQPFLG